MKKKLMGFILVAVFFGMILVSALYVVLANYEYTETAKKELQFHNELIAKIIEQYDLSSNWNGLSFSEDLKGYDYRLTIINNEGVVVYDSFTSAENMENHNDRKEVAMARENRFGSDVHYSPTLDKNMVYVATKIQGDYIIRSAKAVESVKIINQINIKYYLSLLILGFLVTFLISSRLSYILLKPIKDLEKVTRRVARGELDKRVLVTSSDEIGQLGKTFNYMANRLQFTIRDSMDKQSKLEAILKSMDSGVVAIDRNNKIIMINPYAKKLFGIRGNIIGESLFDYIQDFELDKALHGDHVGTKEIKIAWPSEKILRVRTADLLNESEHIGTVAVIHDITDIKKLEKMRSEFVANVSHELKTPLTSIKGFAETLKYVEDKNKRDKFLDIINDEAERLTRLINDILVLSNLENSHEENNNEEIDVYIAVEQVFNLMKNTAESKNIDLLMNLKNNSIIKGSIDKFKQMIINLVDNAIKYSDAGDKVEIGIDKEKNNCIIWVEDNGPGIKEEHLPRLFERFYIVDKARSRSNGGTGLGLAIVKHIAIGLHGTIDLESRYGEGTKFIVKIPSIK
ncbi:Alkaline phosphatase synthesis sensor protein PhoR [Clostridium sp. N3C]|uniref:two-component system histidine kinase PnpS n=1 Tax=Clostridium sp. N3C TaxID=1776758 RepID=UPI00092E19A5|nr:ATP-binding protein [Clostridium sp. N3C]SCN22099.1 Alkaline phosphatase synthesis sensor protein PhoR [Clostridium sp. N3C]